MTSIHEPSIPDARAKTTIQRVADGLAAGKVAGISEIVKLIEALAANAQQITVGELAELIEKDLVVTTKVVAAANTLGYNPSGVEVTSISQAIHVIGFSKIRMLAMSLMLMENATRTQSTDAQKEMATLALTSGMMAQAWAESLSREDAEQVFLCASLRNFGRLLLAALMPEDDRQARAEADVIGDADVAYRTIFGLTPLELGYELLKTASLPEALLSGLRKFVPEMLNAKELVHSDELIVASEFSVRLARLVLRPDLPPSQFYEQSHKLVRQFGKHLHVNTDHIKHILDRTEQRLSTFGQAFGLQSLSRDVTVRLLARRNGRLTPELAAAADAEAAAEAQKAAAEAADSAPVSQDKLDAEPVPESDPGAPVQRSESIGTANASSGRAQSGGDGAPKAVAEGPVRRRMMDILQDTMSLCAEQLAKPVVSSDEVARLVVQAVSEGWAADEVVVLLERGKASFGAVAGIGTNWEKCRQRIAFRREERHVLGVVAARREPVLIHDAGDPKIAPYLPNWFSSGLGLYSCIILPGGDATSCHSVLFAGWRIRQKVTLEKNESHCIRLLLGMVVTARRLAGVHA